LGKGKRKRRKGEGWSGRRGVGDSWEREEGSADLALSNCFNFYVKI